MPKAGPPDKKGYESSDSQSSASSVEPGDKPDYEEK